VFPTPDRYEANDDAGTRAARIQRRRSVKRRASIDFWDDQNDVYAVRLKKGERVDIALHGEKTTDVNLVLWMPGTRRLDDVRSLSGRQVRISNKPGPKEKLSYRAGRSGRYYVQVKISALGAGPGPYPYTLVLVRK
jgi:hypothetical protein